MTITAIWGVPGGGTLDELGDVTIAAPADDQFLRYDGAGWVNETVTLTGTLDGLSDVTIATPAEGHTLYYDATTSQWKNTQNLVVDDVNMRVGIVGTAAAVSPQALFHVRGSTIGGAYTPPSEVAALIDGSANVALSLVTSTSNAAHIYFGDHTNSNPGRITYANNGDYFAIYTGSQHRMNIRASGTLIAPGMLGTSADSQLHVMYDSAGTVTAATNTMVTVENSAAAYLSMLTPNNASSGLLFGDPDDNDVGQITYDHATDAFRITAAATTIACATSTGLGAGTTTTPGAVLHAASTNQPFIAERHSASAGGLPVISIRRSKSATWNTFAAVAANDGAYLNFQFDNGTSYVNGAAIVARATEAHAVGAAGQRLEFSTVDNTTNVTDVRMIIDQDGGVLVGSPTGGSKGPGTINATAVYDDNTILTDHVFDPDYPLMPVDDMAAYATQHRHLPWIDGADTWATNGRAPLGRLATQLWETVECLALYIAELHQRIGTLETT